MTIVSSGQTLEISAGQTSSGIFVESGGALDVLSGGTAISTMVSDGGVEIVESGGVASGTVVSSGGSVELPVTNALTGTPSVIDGVTIQPGALLSLAVYAGGSTSGLVLSSGAVEDVFSGGVAIGTVVSSGAFEFVEAGGIASGSVVSSGGFVELPLTSAYGQWSPTGPNVIDGVTAQSGAIVSLEIFQGGAISGFVVLGGGGVLVFSGGVASGTVVSSGGFDWLSPVALPPRQC